MHHIIFLLKKYFPKIIAALLIMDAAYDTYESLRLIFVDIPAMELQLAAHLLPQSALAELITGLVVKLFKITLNVVFAFRLSKHHETIEILDLVLGLILLAVRSYLTELVAYLHGDSAIGQFMANLTSRFYDAGKGIR